MNVTSEGWSPTKSLKSSSDGLCIYFLTSSCDQYFKIWINRNKVFFTNICCTSNWMKEVWEKLMNQCTCKTVLTGHFWTDKCWTKVFTASNFTTCNIGGLHCWVQLWRKMHRNIQNNVANSLEYLISLWGLKCPTHFTRNRHHYALKTLQAFSFFLSLSQKARSHRKVASSMAGKQESESWMHELVVTHSRHRIYKN